MRASTTTINFTCNAGAAIALLVVLALAGGCYKRVVGVKGPGADAYDVYEPNLKTDSERIESKVHTVPTQKAKD